MAQKRRRRIRWDRVLLVFGPPVLLILILCVCCGKGGTDTGSSSPAEVVPVIQNSIADESAADITQPAVHQPNEYLIVLDPGHGGGDAGALDSTGKRHEKDDNLRLSLAVRDELVKHPHVRVIMTRETDEFLELQERCDIANNAKADFFVSLHRNSATDGDGVEIWVNNNAMDNTMDRKLAEYILELLDKAGISNNRGVHFGFRGSTAVTKSNNYYVNRNTDMPSCLVEMGFMNSWVDNKNFDEKLETYAAAIANALIEIGEDQGIYHADGSPRTTEPEETTATGEAALL